MEPNVDPAASRLKRRSPSEQEIGENGYLVAENESLTLYYSHNAGDGTKSTP